MANLEKMYGYVRVSSKDQNLDRQYDALRRFGVERQNIFADKAGGRDFKRPAYRRMLHRLHEGDVLVIKSIDRLGRDYDEILEEWKRITVTKGVSVVVIDIPLLDTRTVSGNITGKLIADLVLQLLSYVAQVERENIKQRQAEGIAAAKARGVRFGRPCIERPKNYQATKAAYLSGEITRKTAASRLKVCVKTFDMWLRKDEEREGKASDLTHF